MELISLSCIAFYTIQSLCKRGQMSLWTRWQHSNIWRSLFLTGEMLECIYFQLPIMKQNWSYRPVVKSITKCSVGRWPGRGPFWGHWISIWAVGKALRGGVTDRNVSKLRLDVFHEMTSDKTRASRNKDSLHVGIIALNWPVCLFVGL